MREQIKKLLREQVDRRILDRINKMFVGKKMEFQNGVTGVVKKAEVWGKRIHIDLEVDASPSEMIAAGEKLSEKMKSYFNITVSVSVSPPPFFGR